MALKQVGRTLTLPGLAAFLVLLIGDAQAQAADCDLTGQWRSTRGTMSLAQLPGYDVRSLPPSVVDRLPSEGQSASEGQTGYVIVGTFSTPEGDGRLSGTLDGADLVLAWISPVLDAPQDTAGEARFSVSSDCQAVAGVAIDETGIRTDWTARRVTGPSDVDPSSLTNTQPMVDALLGGLERNAADLPTVQGIVERLGPEPEALFEFVQASIAYEPYVGLLRGPGGTLAAGAGNALDQASLLVALLKEAGHEASYAFGTLSDAEGLALLYLSDPVPALPPVRPLTPDERAMLPDSESPGRADGDDLEALSSIFSRALEAMPEQSNEDFFNRQIQLLETASQHAWVQLRRGKQILDLDPSLPDAVFGETPVPLDSTATEVPADLRHTVDIELVVERFDGGGLVEEIAGHWSVNVAGLIDDGVPALTLRVVPLGTLTDAGRQWTGDEFRQALPGLMDDELARGQNFQPALMVSTGGVLLGSPFNLDGELVSTDWRLRNTQQVGESVQTGFNTLTDALQSLETPEEPSASGGLSAVRLDFTIAVPGREPVQRSRWLLDQIGPRVRATGDVDDYGLPDDADRLARAALMSDVTFLVTPGRLSRAFLAQEAINSLRNNMPILEEFAAVQAGEAMFDQRLLGGYDTYPVQLLAMVNRANAISQTIGDRYGVSFVQASPHIVAAQAQIRLGDAGTSIRQRVDLIHVPYQAVPWIGLDPATVQQAQFAQGLAVTDLEHRTARQNALAVCDVCQTVSQDAISLLGQVESFALLEEGASVALQTDEAVQISEELINGGTVLVPASYSQASTPFAWLSIDPATGSVVGMTRDGGEGHSEYVLITGFILFGWAIEQPLLQFLFVDWDIGNFIRQSLRNVREAYYYDEDDFELGSDPTDGDSPAVAPSPQETRPEVIPGYVDRLREQPETATPTTPRPQRPQRTYNGMTEDEILRIADRIRQERRQR